MRRRDDALAAAGALAARPPPKRETLQEYLASAPLPPRRRGREEDGPSNDDGNGPGADARERVDDARGGPSDGGNETLPLRDDDATDPAVRPRRHDGVWDHLRRGKEPWVQCLTIYVAAWLTYSYDNTGDGGANVQVAIMTVIALVAATPLASTHLIPAAIGAFVGGQSVIGSTGPIEDANAIVARNYAWLLLLSLVVGLVWCFVIARLKILDGCAGRLGTTTFVGMNLVMLTAFGPLGVVDWDRYYYGFVHIVHIGEEDASRSLATAWAWTEEAEVAIGYVLSVLWLGVVAGFTRIRHNDYVRRIKAECPVSNEAPPAPLNNVSVPCLMALASMLAINATEYKHAPGLYNGFAVGAYVAMASLQKIPSVSKFARVSLLAAGWGLALTPFFVGFAGKSGFTSMLGHVTHVALESLVRRIRSRRRQQRRRESERLRREASEHQTLQSSSSTGETTREAPPSPPHLHHKPKKEAFITKQQRRQRQRLQHLQGGEERPPDELPATPPRLHHRAWSALPRDGDGKWEHSLESGEGSDVV